MNLEFEAAKHLAVILASDAGIRLEMVEGVKVPSTNKSRITMPMLRPEWDNDSPQAVTWWTTLIHECRHHEGSNYLDLLEVVKRDIDTTSLYGTILNIVVDHNIENKGYGKLEGIDHWTDTFITDAFHNIKANFDRYPESPLKVMIAFDAMCRSMWANIPNFHLEMELSDEMQKMYDKLVKECCDDYLMPRSGGWPNIELTNRICAILRIESEIPENAQSQDGDGESDERGSKSDEQPGKGGDKNSSEPKDDSESENSGDSSESSDGSPETETESGASEKENKEAIKRFYDDSKRDKEISNGEKGSRVDYEYDTSRRDTSRYAIAPAKEIVTKDNKCKASKKKINRAKNLISTGLSSKVRNLLKVLSQVKWNGGYKRGKLHKKAVSRVSSGSDRIFRQKEQKITLDTAVCVLLDSSGSMEGGRYLNGMAACAMLNDTMNKIGVPCEILGFSQDFDTGENEHFIHSTYNERTTTDDLLTAMSSVELQNNDDGAAIMWAHSRLIRQKAKRKVLIALSDGQPACKQVQAWSYTLKVVEEIEKNSPVEIYGIGICSESVEELYIDHAVINDPSELEETLLTVVKNKIIS